MGAPPVAVGGLGWRRRNSYGRASCRGRGAGDSGAGIFMGAPPGAVGGRGGGVGILMGEPPAALGGLGRRRRYSYGRTACRARRIGVAEQEFLWAHPLQ